MRLFGLFLSLIILLALNAGCSKQQTPSVIVKKGTWAAPISITGDLYPLGDGEEAWVWSYDPPGLYLVNPNGDLLNKDKPLFAGVSGKDGILFIARDTKHAWAKISEGSSETIYVIDTAGTINRVGRFDDKAIGSLYPFADGTAALAVMQFKAGAPLNQEFRLLKADGSNVSLNIPGPSQLSKFSFYPIGDTEAAWMVTTGEGFENVFIVNTNGNIDSLSEHLPQGAKIRTWSTNDDDWVMWAAPEGPGLFVVNPSLHLLGQPIAALAHETVDAIVPALNAGAWVLSREKKLYFIEDSTKAPIEINLPKTDKIIKPSADGKAAWIVADEKLYFVESNGNIVRVETDGITINARGYLPLFPFGNGQRVFFIGFDKEQNTLFLADAAGKVIKRQKTSQNNPDLINFPSAVDFQASNDGTTLYTITPFGINAYDSSAEVTDEGKPILGRIINGNVFTTIGPGGGSRHFRSTYPAGAGKRIWAHSSRFARSPGSDAIEGANYIVGTAADVSEASISFDSETLSLGSDFTAALTLDPQAVQTVAFKLNWYGPGYASQIAGLQFGKRFDEAVDGRVDLEILDGDTKVAHGSAKMSESVIPFTWDRKTVRWNYPYNFVLKYTDKLGSHVQIQWTGVQFHVPLLQRKWFKTIVVYLSIILVLALLVLASHYLRSVAQATARWLPFGIYLLTLVAGKLPTEIAQRNINGTLLLTLLVATILLCVPTGLISPSVFRSLAQVAPFHWLAPPALMLPFLRRRVFADYVDWLESQINAARVAANNESYVAIPTDVTQQMIPPVPGSAPPKSKTIGDAAAMICALLTSPDPKARANVLIESPGGRGKSALVREVLLLSIDKFRQNPRSPLPVVSDGKNDLNEDMIARALGRYLISRDLLAPQLKAGDFFISIDGLSESSIKPDSIKEFIASEYGKQTSLLFSSRNDEHRKAFTSAPRWMIVEPRRLDHETLELFEKTYIEEDEKRTGKKLPKLTNELKRSCQGADGLYLPILIRLAILASGNPIHGVADLYEGTFRRLLKTGGGADEQDDRGLLDEAAAMCVETYWQDGLRTLAYASAPSQRFKLLKRLKDAGILVPTDDKLDAFENPPDEVGFFHDSMQSYLTARGLFNNTPENWQALERAAGDMIFIRAQSDLLTGAGSEIFQMCLHVFRPKDRLRRVLKEDLLRWADSHGDDLTKNNVYNAMPRDLEQKLRQSVEAEAAVTGVLRVAVSMCEKSDEQINEINNLAILYSRIAPLVWSKKRGLVPAIGHERSAQPTLKTVPQLS